MNKKNLLLVPLVTFGLCVASSFAQSVGPFTTTLNGGTNNVAATATNSYTLTQNVSDYDTVGFQVSAKPNSTSTGNLTFRVAKSMDGITYETVPSQSLMLPFSGTGTVTANTSFSVGSAAYVQITAVENTNAMAITNIVAKFRFKQVKRQSIPATRQ